MALTLSQKPKSAALRPFTFTMIVHLLILLVGQVSAFPGGVGGCAGGRAAVEGAHLATSARITGAIGNARLQMILDDDLVLRASTRMDFTVGGNHTLTLRKIDDNAISFRGFLFRLGTPLGDAAFDTTDALRRTTPDTSVAFEHCVINQGVGGLSHANSNVKESVSGILRLDEPANDMPLDVTVVIQNRNGLSEFYYQRFFLNAVTGTTSGPGGPAPAPQTPTLPPLPPSLLDSIPPNVAPALPPNVAPALPPNVAAPSTSPPTVAPVTSTAAPATSAPIGDGGGGPPDTDRKEPDASKCDSLGSRGGRGGSAGQSKDCSRVSAGGGTRRRKLKGSSY